MKVSDVQVRQQSNVAATDSRGAQGGKRKQGQLATSLNFMDYGSQNLRLMADYIAYEILS